MPWTAKQLKLFRAAAHNPAIAKSSGIKQADAERMSKEGLKKAKGGAVQAMINRQDTRHGKMDTPYQKLNRFAGMKKGGIMKKNVFMKKRRFDEGGDVGSLEDEGFDKSGEGEDTVYRKSFAGGVKMSDEAPAPKTAPAAKLSSKDYGDEGSRMRARYGEDSSPVTANPRGARGMGFRRDMPSDAQKTKNAREFAKEVGMAAIGGGYGKMLQGAARAQKAANAARANSARRASFYEEADPTTGMSRGMVDRAASKKYGIEGPKGVTEEIGMGYKKGGLMRSKKDIGKDQMGMAPYKKGGEMESKAMMKKEIGFMQKKGAPASMIKHEKAEMKGYKKGGSIKETMGPRNMSQDVEKGSNTRLKHGEHGIQKRGHTRGMEERMQGGPKKFAAGGSVRAHGEHSIQLKGHTRGKVY